MKLASFLTLAALGAASQAGAATVFSTTSPTSVRNLAAGGTATQSTTRAAGGAAERAIDGNYNPIFGGNSITHTNTENQPWWQVDLGSSQRIDHVTLYDRMDCCDGRLSDFNVIVGDDPTFSTSNSTTSFAGNPPGHFITLDTPATGQYVRVQLNANNAVLSLTEVEVQQDASFLAHPMAGNLALTGTASQSTTGFGGTADRGNDGRAFGRFGPEASTTHTNPAAAGDFWEVSLTDSAFINEIVLYNRADCCGERLADFDVSIFQGDNEVFNTTYTPAVAQAGLLSISDDAGFLGRGDRVRITTNGAQFLSLSEVQVFGVVPEPSRAMLLAIGALGLIARRRR